MIRLTWEVWPKSKNGSQGDPITRTHCVPTLIIAIDKANRLKKTHGKSLRYVNMTQQIIG